MVALGGWPTVCAARSAPYLVCCTCQCLLHVRLTTRRAMAKRPAFEQCSGYMGSCPLRVRLCAPVSHSRLLHAAPRASAAHARLLHLAVCRLARRAMAKCPAFEQCSGYMGSCPLRVRLCAPVSHSRLLHAAPRASAAHARLLHLAVCRLAARWRSALLLSNALAIWGHGHCACVSVCCTP